MCALSFVVLGRKPAREVTSIDKWIHDRQRIERRTIYIDHGENVYRRKVAGHGHRRFPLSAESRARRPKPPGELTGAPRSNALTD